MKEPLSTIWPTTLRMQIVALRAMVSMRTMVSAELAMTLSVNRQWQQGCKIRLG